jgi:hypothetical protein
MISFQPDLTPSMADDAGWQVAEIPKKRKKLRESKIIPIPEITDDIFDDTFRLREAQHPGNFSSHGENNNPEFERGVPTNGKTSTDNYSKGKTQIIDGEHKTLLSLGKISEAMEDDDHASHIFEHRMLLANPNLSETQRSGLLEHISDHTKKHRKKLKAVTEAFNNQNRKDILPGASFRPGLGKMSHPKPATTYDAIPQDTGVDAERKRTAGNMAMESRMKRFDNAVKTAYGSGSRRSL